MGIWEDYIGRLQSDIEQIRKDLAPLESGGMRLGERTGAGPWRDVTQGWIEHHKRTILPVRAQDQTQPH
jgi:hypothetical protein